MDAVIISQVRGEVTCPRLSNALRIQAQPFELKNELCSSVLPHIALNHITFSEAVLSPLNLLLSLYPVMSKSY